MRNTWDALAEPKSKESNKRFQQGSKRFKRAQYRILRGRSHVIRNSGRFLQENCRSLCAIRPYSAASASCESRRHVFRRHIVVNMRQSPSNAYAYRHVKFSLFRFFYTFSVFLACYFFWPNLMNSEDVAAPARMEPIQCDCTMPSEPAHDCAICRFN